MAKHFLQEQRPATVKPLGLLIPYTQGEQQQGKQENAQGFQAKTVAVIHRLTCQVRDAELWCRLPY